MYNKHLKKLKLAHKNMLDRCYNPKNSSYKNYGGRGIEVCRKWKKSRASFIEWALHNGHEVVLSLDRIDNSKNYTPSNCRWATKEQQLNNQRRNVILVKDKIKLTQSQWAKKLGIGVDALYRRINKYGIITTVALTSGRLNAWQHGTRQGYERYKCKCELCTKANTERHKKRRENKKHNLISISHWGLK